MPAKNFNKLLSKSKTPLIIYQTANTYLFKKINLGIHHTLLTCYHKLLCFIPAFLLLSLLFATELNAQINPAKEGSTFATFGYTDKGDSVEFVFGQQKKIIVSGIEVSLEKRMSEITQVNVAGDFNGWKPDAPKYHMTKMDGKLFKITVSKTALGKKGELRQFKFVLNHKYWVEPPTEAQNKFKGADGNTNLTLRL